MPPTRWAAIIGVAITEEAEAALDKQANGEPLTDAERQILVEANTIINGEIDRWSRGEPFDPDEEAPAPTETPGPTDLGPPTVTTPLPGESPGFDPVTGEVTGAAPSSPSTSTATTLPPNRPDQIAAGASIDAAILPPGRPDQIQAGAAIDDAILPPQAPPRPARPPSTPGGVGVQPTLPPPISIGPPAAAPAPPSSRPAAPSASTPRPAPAAPAPPPVARPKPPPAFRPAPVADPPPMSIAPPRDPFDNAEGDSIGQGPLRGAIERAGGRATAPVASRVAAESEQIREQGWSGHTTGWQALAQAAAAAWERQYRENPTELQPAERRAYEEDPESLRREILEPTSPFRDYREAWIGAFRKGEEVPGGRELAQELATAGGSFRSPYGAAPAAAPAAPTVDGLPTPDELGPPTGEEEPRQTIDTEIPPDTFMYRQPMVDIAPPEGIDLTEDVVEPLPRTRVLPAAPSNEGDEELGYWDEDGLWRTYEPELEPWRGGNSTTEAPEDVMYRESVEEEDIPEDEPEDDEYSDDDDDEIYDEYDEPDVEYYEEEGYY